MTPEKFQQIKDQIEKAQTEKIKAEARLESLLTRLKTEFECDSIAAAEDLVTSLKEQSESLMKKIKAREKQIEEALEAIEK